MWPRPFEQFFFPKGPGGCMWSFVTIGPAVSEEKLFEIVDGQTDGQWTTEPAYTISSPGAFGSGELKILSCIVDHYWQKDKTEHVRELCFPESVSPTFNFANHKILAPHADSRLSKMFISTSILISPVLLLKCWQYHHIHLSRIHLTKQLHSIKLLID